MHYLLVVVDEAIQKGDFHLDSENRQMVTNELEKLEVDPKVLEMTADEKEAIALTYGWNPEELWDVYAMILENAYANVF
jgi:hypothetical protein